METTNNINGPKSGNPDVRGITNPQTTPTKGGDQTPRPHKPGLEEIIIELLRGAAKKAGAELDGMVLPACIAAAEDNVARREAKAVIAKAINYAKAIATGKKFRGHHLLRELGIKMPTDNDTGGNAGGKSKESSKGSPKTDPPQSGKAQPDPGKSGQAKPKQGNAGEGAKQ